jgi:hypothetical protein
VLGIVTSDEKKAASAVDGCGLNNGEPRLAAPRGRIIQAFAREPAHQPKGQRQEAKYHNEAKQHFHRTIAKQGVHRSSLLLARASSVSFGLPEWLTPGNMCRLQY